MECERFCSLALPRLLAAWWHGHAAFVIGCPSKLSSNESCKPALHFFWVCQTDRPCSLQACVPLDLYFLNYQIYCICTCAINWKTYCTGLCNAQIYLNRNTTAMHALSHFINSALSCALYHIKKDDIQFLTAPNDSSLLWSFTPWPLLI